MAYKTTYWAGGILNDIRVFPRFHMPYTKGAKLEMFNPGTYAGSVTLNYAVELIGISVISSSKDFCSDYVELWIGEQGKEVQLIETLYLQNLRSNGVSEIYFKKAYPIASEVPITFKYKYEEVDNPKYKAIFFNFHYLKKGSSNVPEHTQVGGNGYNRTPTDDDKNKDGDWFNLIGTDEDGNKSVDWNHKRYKTSTNFETKEINGKKILKSKTPASIGKIPLIEKPLKVVELTPYSINAHPEGLSVLQYISRNYGVIDGQQLLDIDVFPYSQMDSIDLSKYDALFFSPGDCNCNQDITESFRDKVLTFADNGKPVLACHDTMNLPVFQTLASNFSLKLDNDETTYWSGDRPSVEVMFRDKITDYPYKLPDVFEVLAYHRTGKTIKLGDNWIIDQAGLNFTQTFTKNYVWMSSNENMIFLEAGHMYYTCSGYFHMNPLEWESKAIINALYYAIPPDTKQQQSTADYIVNIPETNTKGGYITMDISCWTEVPNNSGGIDLKPGACVVEIYNDSQLLETVTFPQNDLAKSYYDKGWNTFRYMGELGIFANSKTVRFRYKHTSTNVNAFLELDKCDVKLFK